MCEYSLLLHCEAGIALLLHCFGKKTIVFKLLKINGFGVASRTFNFGVFVARIKKPLILMICFLKVLKINGFEDFKFLGFLWPVSGFPILLTNETHLAKIQS